MRSKTARLSPLRPRTTSHPAALYALHLLCHVFSELNLFYPARRGFCRVRGQYRRGERADAARHGRNGANDAIRFGESNIAAELEKLDMEGVGKTVEALRGAAQKLADADIDAVNDGIEALTDAAGNLQNLDIEKLNDLIAALEKTAAQMEKTSAAFGKLFGK